MVTVKIKTMMSKLNMHGSKTNWGLRFVSIDIIRILTVGLERAYNCGLCGEYHLNLKRFPCTSLCCMLVPVRP